MTESLGGLSTMTELLGAGEEEGSMERALAATGWGREEGVGSSWLDDFFQSLDPGAGTGGQGLAIDQWVCLQVT